jgi:hypothetical protein
MDASPQPMTTPVEWYRMVFSCIFVAWTTCTILFDRTLPTMKSPEVVAP